MSLRSIILMILACVCAAISAQDRKITPVERDDKKPQAPVLHYYDKHGDELDEPVLVLLDTDTVKNVTAKPVYPLLHQVDIGANFMDAIFKLAGQSYASFDVWAALSLFNWISPVVETGIGFADNTPKGNNFTYVCHPSFYVKAGFNYNFLYKSNPDYQVYIGFRAGFSSFSYDVNDISISNDYWGQTNDFSLGRQNASAWYGEALAGLQVKIAGPISLGWSIRYHFKMKVNDGANSSPWFIPGYGAKSPITATFSVIYNLPLHKKMATDKPGAGTNT